MHFVLFSSHGLRSLIPPIFFICFYISPIVVLQQCTTFRPQHSQLQMQGTLWFNTVFDKCRIGTTVCSQDEVPLTIHQTHSWDVLYLKCASACFESAGATIRHQSYGNVPSVFSVYCHSAQMNDRMSSWNMLLVQPPQSSMVHFIRLRIQSVSLHSGLGTASSARNLEYVFPCSSTCLISHIDVELLTSVFWSGLTPSGNISQHVTELLFEILAVYLKNSLIFH
jgi:hypothetical protein